MTVLDAGKAALTEKPGALDAAQATCLIDSAR
jgi:predicted dehydrogenase